MILYFADRHLNILGQAATHLPEGVKIIKDNKTEDVETGVSIFECTIPFDRKTRSKVENWTEVGNYILRSSDDKNEFYSIIDAEIDTKRQEVYIYAEDDGLDLLNDIAEAYEADQPYPIATYIERFASGSGWEIGINEVEGLTRKLSWDSEQTTTARLLNIAEAFDNCEITFSFEINGLQLSKKYIDIYEKRGKDTGIQLRLNREIDSIITTKSVANLATALKVKGGTPDNEEDPITLLNYEYDDGDFYVDGYVLKSRKALEKWSRYLWKDDDSKQSGGHIVKEFSYDTTSQAVLCEKAIAELKVVCDMEVNYDIDISQFPENVRIGDRVNIVDDAGELYLSSRVLILETSVSDQMRKAVLGEHLIRKSGISKKVEQLAADFAKSTVMITRAKTLATTAKEEAQLAQAQAAAAMTKVDAAQIAADNAKAIADAAEESALNAKAQALAAEAAVDKVEESVQSIQTTVENAKAAADYAHEAAEIAKGKADEAKTASENAVKDAVEAKIASAEAKTAAESAISNANTAKDTAEVAKTTAEAASVEARAAKLDAQQAEQDVAAFEENLETFKQTVSADYSRKTDLTETTAELQAQITANAAQLEITHSKVLMVDETVNDAAEKAQQAKDTADLAKSQADQATADANTAQDAATRAAEAAASAQSEANTAKDAATTAQGVADKAAQDLAKAEADLATVSGRVDATEEEIAAAQQAVTTAQAAADKANTDAQAATVKAEAAQDKANKAATDAANAQATASSAAEKAEAAQAIANEAKGKAEDAHTAANSAVQAAENAQTAANTAVANATNAQTKANEAATAATNAQTVADEAKVKANQAETDLAKAQSDLADTLSRVDATEEEVAAAKTAVATAQAAADTAKQNADNAQEAADAAQATANEAQAEANRAKTAADEAQEAADAAQAAADKAIKDVNALTVRVTDAETNISKSATKIELNAYKTEVAQTLGGYFTKEETEAKIEEAADAINLSVSSTYATKQATDGIGIGGRNLLLNTGGGDPIVVKHDDAVHTTASITKMSNEKGVQTYECSANGSEIYYRYMIPSNVNLYGLEVGKTYTISGKAKVTTKSGNFNKLTIRTQNYIGAWTGGIGKDVATADTNDWVPFSVTFTIDEAATGCYVSFQVYYTSSWVGTIQTKEVKLELGTRATDWTPAPEDLISEKGLMETLGGYYTKKETDAAINIKSDSILGTVKDATTIKDPVTGVETTVKDNISTVQQTANALTLRFDNLALGGRNLIAKTSKNEIALGGYPASSSSGSNEGYSGRTIDVVNKKEYVLSFDAKSTVAGDKITCYFFSPATTTRAVSSTGQTSTLADGNIKVTLGTSWKRYWVKYTQSEETASAKSIIVGRRIYGDGSGSVSIRAIKLEEGHVPSDWTQAPEDITGTVNYMKFENGVGLTIGDLTANTLGNNVLISSSSVSIRNGTTVAADFGSKTITLGRYAADSKINLCGGKGIIQIDEYSSGEEYLRIASSDCLRLHSEGPMEIVALQDDEDGRAFIHVSRTSGDIIVPCCTIQTKSSAGVGYLSVSPNSIDARTEGNVSIRSWSKYVEIYAQNSQFRVYSQNFDLRNTELTLRQPLYLSSGNSIYIPNAAGLYGTSTSGEERVLVQYNGNNNTVIGYGGYYNSEGSLNIYGNKINMYVKTANASYKPYYEKGDSFTIDLHTAGYCTTSATQVIFAIPLSKPVIGNPTVTVANVNGMMMRQNNKYTHGSNWVSGTGDVYAKPTYSGSCSIEGNGTYIKVVAVFTDTTNATNNSSIGVRAWVSVTFS